MSDKWPEVESVHELIGKTCPSCKQIVKSPCCTFSCVQCGYPSFKFTPTDDQKKLQERANFIVRAYCL